MEKTIDIYRMRNLCIKHQWFTHGSNFQYDKMFELVGAMEQAGKTDTHLLATVIWLCSEQPRAEIETALEGELK